MHAARWHGPVSIIISTSSPCASRKASIGKRTVRPCSTITVLPAAPFSSRKSRARWPAAARCGIFSPGVGEIKRMWVAPQVRGRGVGRKLLGALEHAARERRLLTVRLDTHASLAEALHLYRTSGYREIPRFNDNPYAHHWFEKTLV